MEAKSKNEARVSDSCILLGGQPRSGTTLLSSILGSAPGHVQAFELHVRKPSFVVGLKGRYTRNIFAELGLPVEKYDEIVTGFDKSAMNLGAWTGLIEAHSAEPLTGKETNRFDEEMSARCQLVKMLMRALCEHLGRSSWGLKILSDIIFADKYAAAWPDTHFIHLIRDPRDQAMSVIQLNEARHRRGQPPFYASYRDAAKGWKKNLLGARKTAAEHAVRIIEIKYEHLVERPDEILSKLGEQIGLEQLGESSRRFFRNEMVQEHVSRFEHHGNVLNPITKSRVNKWKKSMTDEDIAIFKEECGDLMSALGYEL